jgi:alpha-beta hydrolase superfamily lysophospholipase
MISENFTFKDKENMDIFVYKWSPEQKSDIKGVVQISHGMAETAARYERFANVLVDSGFIVYANDHRGHGRTAKVLENLGYLGDKDGYNFLVENMHQLTEIVVNENKGIPVILLGHSMGSFLTQRYISKYGDELRGAILSGTNGDQGMILNIGLIIAKLEIHNKGRKAKSELLNKMCFGAYNKAFKPNRTDFDWLSNDNAEVDKYVNDPFCGSVFTTSFYYDFFSGLKETYKLENVIHIPKELPIYILSGEKDPVGNNTKGVMKLINTYKRIGLKNIKYKFYKNGRHEMLNDINRDEVIEDIINWINEIIK